MNAIDTVVDYCYCYSANFYINVHVYDQRMHLIFANNQPKEEAENKFARARARHVHTHTHEHVACVLVDF